MQENRPRNGDKPKGTSLKTLLREEFQVGVKDSKAPENAWLPDQAIRKTTMYSPWFMRICPFCGLEFREGNISETIKRSVIGRSPKKLPCPLEILRVLV